ncbi:MAG: hypothetical protein U5L98_17140 [Halomonas sp.]|uniref:hypothetical protein n=1 Tax=Halomonas sp. TaxID=1486246 RepID=UPI002ACEC995|nr:hypothetical protein [Halomonas sp.]MDZ7854302.1 hypothetical protein [Halomonas sp.]
MNTHLIRRFVETSALHQTNRISEHAAIVAGVKNAGGTRQHPSLETYIDIAVQHPMGYCSRFGIQSAIMEDRMPAYLLDDVQVRESIDFLVMAGLIANSDHAANMIRLTADDTIKQALKLIYTPS